MTAICPACNSTNTSRLHYSKKQALTTTRCTMCDLRFIQERLDAAQQAELYENEANYRAFAEAERSVDAVPKRRKEWAELLSRAIEIDSFERATGRRPRLLDIGCGVGDFLVVAREVGFDPYGLELSPAAAKLARHYNDLDVTIGSFECERREGYFEAIALLGVLEHVRQPNELLSHVSKLLAPGGVVLIYTPVWGLYDTLSSSVARLTGGRWSRLIDRRINTSHLQIFPRRTLQTLAKRNGLEVGEAVSLCEYNLPVHHYLSSMGFKSGRVKRATENILDILIATNFFFRNNQRILASKVP